MLSADDERRLARLAAEGDRHARDQLIEANLRLVVAIARRYQGLGLPLDDLVQEGAVGLAAAADRYEWRRDARFATYASWWIRQAILRALTEQSRTIRLPHHVVANQIVLRRVRANLAAHLGRPATHEELAAATGLDETAIEIADAAPAIGGSLNDPFVSADPDDLAEPVEFVQDEAAADPEEIAIEDDTRESLLAAMSELTPRERGILMRHFGLDGAPETLSQISEGLGVTRERVRQLEQHALARLAHDLHYD